MRCAILRQDLFYSINDTLSAQGQHVHGVQFSPTQVCQIPQGWDDALCLVRGASAAVAAVLPSSVCEQQPAAADPKNLTLVGVSSGQLAGPNAGTPLTMLSLETGDLEVTLVAPAPAGVTTCS